MYWMSKKSLKHDKFNVNYYNFANKYVLFCSGQGLLEEPTEHISGTASVPDMKKKMLN